MEGDGWTCWSFKALVSSTSPQKLDISLPKHAFIHFNWYIIDTNWYRKCWKHSMSSSICGTGTELMFQVYLGIQSVSSICCFYFRFCAGSFKYYGREWICTLALSPLDGNKSIPPTELEAWLCPSRIQLASCRLLRKICHSIWAQFFCGQEYKNWKLNKAWIDKEHKSLALLSSCKVQCTGC